MNNGVQSSSGYQQIPLICYMEKSLEYEVLQIRYILYKYIHDNKGDSSTWFKEAIICAADFKNFVRNSSLTHDNLKRYITQTLAPTFTSSFKSRLGLKGASTLRNDLEIRAGSFPSSKQEEDKYKYTDNSGKSTLISTLLSEIAGLEMLLLGFSEEVDSEQDHNKYSMRRRKK